MRIFEPRLPLLSSLGRNLITHHNLPYQSLEHDEMEDKTNKRLGGFRSASLECWYFHDSAVRIAPVTCKRARNNRLSSVLLSTDPKRQQEEPSLALSVRKHRFEQARLRTLPAS